MRTWLSFLNAGMAHDNLLETNSTGVRTERRVKATKLEGRESPAHLRSIHMVLHIPRLPERASAGSTCMEERYPQVTPNQSQGLKPRTPCLSAPNHKSPVIWSHGAIIERKDQKSVTVCGGAIQTLAWVRSGPVQVPSRVPSGPVQIRHVLCFTVFRTHPGPEVGAIPARPGPILVPSVSPRIGPGRAETDFLATSDSDRKNFPQIAPVGKLKSNFQVARFVKILNLCWYRR